MKQHSTWEHLHKSIKKFLPAFFFVLKIILLTWIFTILWIYFFYEAPLRDPVSDHIHSTIPHPTLEETRKTNHEIKPQEVLEMIQEELIPETIWENEHGVSIPTSFAQERLEMICWAFSDICNKTVRNYQYSLEEQLFYQWMLIYLIEKIDEKFAQGTLRSLWRLRDTLSFVEMNYTDQWRRWSAWHTFIRLNTHDIPTREEFRNVATHEFGHVKDLWVIQGTSRNKDTYFTEFWRVIWSIDDPSLDFYRISRQAENVRHRDAQRLDFVSGYAMVSAYEDFAESFNMYLNHYELFRQMAQDNRALQRKFLLLQQRYWIDPLQHWSAHLHQKATTFRPRDTTRIR